MGSFCPLTRVSMPSMTETPVWMRSVGYSRLSGFIGAPFTSRKALATGSGRPSWGLPSPSNTLPRSWSDTGSSIVFPRKRALVPDTERPEVPSKTWTTALPNPVSSTLASLRLPVLSSISTSSSKAALSTPSTTRSGPLISATLLYSSPEDDLLMLLVPPERLRRMRTHRTSASQGLRACLGPRS